jgi:heme/copper-type cytochrome/quinol oxidase subunit 2
MSAVLAPFLADAAEEGRNIILSMLVVGLVFLAVIGLGELNDWRGRRRKRLRRR